MAMATLTSPANQNAFSVLLSPLNFNLFSIFVVDFMHEVELGIWKSLFLHLLRMLDTMDGALNKLDSRYAMLLFFFALINAFLDSGGSQLLAGTPFAASPAMCLN